MYIKVFPHGKGRGEKAVQYLINNTYANRKDNPPKILRGDPDMTTELINSLPFAWKYTSGVLSWSSEDTVSQDNEEKLMDDFENVAFAGLNKGQYSILWVRHKHANHHELHFIIPRVELTQGKSFNAFSPGWQKDFDVLRDYYNIKHNWTRPDDPKRQRICVPSNASLLHNKLKRFGVEINREELINAYKELGLTISRAGKNYITIKNGEQKIRLKGGIFDESWRIGAKDTGKANSRETNAGTGNDSELGKLQGKLEQIIAKRSDYTRKRYKSIRNEEQGSHQIEYLFMKNYCIYLTGFFLLLFLIIAGSRLVTFYLENNIYRLEEQIQQLEGEAYKAQQTLNTMKTMGITLQNVNGKNFIVIPENLSYETGWIVGSSHAIRIHD